MTRVLVAGASTSPVCGVRDAAAALEPALVAAGASVETLWWERASGESGRGWAARVAAADADAILWHYSVFAYAVRGLPLLLPPVLRELRHARAPLVGLLHELVFPWRGGGVRGPVFASTHRAALALLVRRLDGVAVTTEDRLGWLRSRRWLPPRPSAFVPVVSNVPRTPATAERNGVLRVGVFGFRREPPGAERVVAEAVARLAAGGVPASLRLIGAPGPDAPESRRWRAACAAAGCELSFSGIVPADALSRELSSADALVLADACGPTSRRGTLAAALAHGRPVVAFDGPQRWSAVADAGAVVLVERDAGLLAGALAGLAADRRALEAQGARAAAFYEREMAPHVVAPRLLDLCREAAR